MSLLDRFVLLFETDASESASDVRDLNSSLNESEEAAEDAAKQMDNLKGAIKDVIVAYVGLSAIKAAVFDIARADDVVGKFSQTLGLNVSDVDAYGAAVERSGGSAESFRGSLSALNDQLTELSLTGAGDIAQTLARLGVSATDAAGNVKSAFDLLPEISEAFQGLSAKESFGLGKRLGLDQGTILLLQQTRNNMENLVEQQRQLGGRTEESSLAVANFNDQIDNVGRGFEGFFRSANTKLLPVLTEILIGFQDIFEWMSTHEEFVTGFILVVGGAITASLIPVMTSLAVAVGAALGPFALIGGVVVSLGLVFAAFFEDVNAYIAGQESFIGKLFDKYKWLETGIKGAINGILDIWEVLKADLDWIKLLFDDPMTALDQLKQGFVNLFNFIKGLFDFSFIGDSVSGALDATRDFFGIEKENIEGTQEFNDAGIPIVGSNDILQNTRRGLATQAAYAANPVNSLGNSSAITNNSNSRKVNIQFGEIKIDASGMSANEAKGLVGDSLKQQIAMAIGYLDDGVIS